MTIALVLGLLKFLNIMLFLFVLVQDSYTANVVLHDHSFTSVIQE